MAAPATKSDATATPPPDDFDLDAPLFIDQEPEAPQREYVAVLHGYGKVEPKTHNIVLGKDKIAYEFTGGVCKQVPREVAEDWKRLPGYRMILVPWPKDKETGDPVEPSTVEFAKASGIRPMDVNKLAAYIGAANLDKLIEAMGKREAEELLAAIESRVKKLPRR